jgi:hypothetical protein
LFLAEEAGGGVAAVVVAAGTSRRRLRVDAGVMGRLSEKTGTTAAAGGGCNARGTDTGKRDDNDGGKTTADCDNGPRVVVVVVDVETEAARCRRCFSSSRRTRRCSTSAHRQECRRR